ncbi:MAG: leucine-rich repeat domain-containing protein [Treponema socranskii subsp. buccale]
MTKSKTHKKKGAAAIVTAVIVLAALSIFTACSNAAQMPDAGGGTGTSSEAPFVEGGVSFILSPDKLDITVKVTTSGGTSVTVEGCTVTTFTSDTETTLHAKDILVILKGKITELKCYSNQLTELNVQGLTALQKLDCDKNQLTALNVQSLTALQSLACDWNQLTVLNVQGLTALQELYCSGNQLTALDVQGLTALRYLGCWDNQLNADAFKKLFDDLPQRADSDDANCILYTEQTGVTEGNHTDFTAPQDLKDAFNNAKNNKKWKMYKRNGSWPEVEI